MLDLLDHLDLADNLDLLDLVANLDLLGLAANLNKDLMHKTSSSVEE